MEFFEMSPQIVDATLLFVRVVLGVTMMYYGLPKMKNLKSNAADFVKMGFKPGWLWGTIVALLEVVGGLIVLLGVPLLTSIVAVMFMGEMALGTLWKITKTDKPFTDWSYDVLLAALALVVLVFGAGSIAL